MGRKNPRDVPKRLSPYDKEEAIEDALEELGEVEDARQDSDPDDSEWGDDE